MRALFVLLIATLSCYACLHPRQAAVSTAVSVAGKPVLPDLTVLSLDGRRIPLSQYRGRKIIILNVASQCGYTPQYADWEQFYAAHMANVVVLGFPCNDFGQQEPGTAGEIAAFCQKNYGVTFPLFEKVHVKGTEQAPLYRWLSDPAQNGWNSSIPTWNFCKYVLNEKGELTHFFDSKVKPEDAAFRAAVGM